MECGPHFPLVSSNRFPNKTQEQGWKTKETQKDPLGDKDVTFLKLGKRECFQQSIRPLHNSAYKFSTSKILLDFTL